MVCGGQATRPRVDRDHGGAAGHQPVHQRRTL